MQKTIECEAGGFLLRSVDAEALLKGVSDCPPPPAFLSEIAVDKNSTVERGDAATALRERLADMLENRAYRDCLTLVRHRLEAIYVHRKTAPRDEVLHLAGILTDLLVHSGRQMEPDLARQIAALESQSLDARSHYKVQELFCQITDMLFASDADRDVLASERIETALRFIERNLAKGVTLEEAAGVAHVSPCYLSRLFRKEMGMTFMAYLKAQQIGRAKALLKNSDLPITNVALDLSYADANYFCKAFKKEVGISPSEYRRRFQKHVDGAGNVETAT